MDYPQLVAIAYSNKVYRALSGYDSLATDFRPLSKTAERQVERIFTFFREGGKIPYQESRLLIQIQQMQERALAIPELGPIDEKTLRKYGKAVHVLVHYPDVDWVAGILPEMFVFEFNAIDKLVSAHLEKFLSIVLERDTENFHKVYHEVGNHALTERWMASIEAQVVNNISNLLADLKIGFTKENIELSKHWLTTFIFVRAIKSVYYDDKDKDTLAKAVLAFSFYGFELLKTGEIKHISDAELDRAEKLRATFTLITRKD